MGDFYSEKLIKKKTGAKEIMIKALLIFLTVLAAFSVFLTMFGMIFFVLAVVLDVVVFRRLDIEYEYQYINGDLDIDKIMHKERRKSGFSMNIRDMELLAPAEDPRLLEYQDVRVLDYTSGVKGIPSYGMIVAREGMKVKILFEPDDSMVEEIWMRSPSRVIRRQH